MDVRTGDAPALVAEAAALGRVIEAVADEPAVALDTESNSFHVYRERICLLQLSTRTGDWVVDPLAVDPRPLLAALDAGPTVILHGADYDVRCLKREYGWQVPRLFDTMAAARLLGRPGLGLSALVQAHFGVRLSKEFQRSDWGRRPLGADQVRYAALDTHFLLPLRDLLVAELAQRGLAQQAEVEFRKIAAVEPRPRVFDPEGWRRLKAARTLEAESRAVLRALWMAREERAAALDRPPFKVLGEHTLVDIARQRPRDLESLGRIPGMTRLQIRRVGDLVLAAVTAASDGA